MKPFRFRLQAVLTVRERHEKFAMERYSKALGEVNRARLSLERADAAWAASSVAQSELLRRGTTAADLRRGEQYCHELEQRRQASLSELRKAQAGAGAAREAMLKARIEREAVDQFRAQQRSAYDLEASRAEQKDVDEWAQRQPKSSSGRASSCEIKS